jgi:hypothetical protein
MLLQLAAGQAPTATVDMQLHTCFATLLPQLYQVCHPFAQPLVVTVEPVIPIEVNTGTGA